MTAITIFIIIIWILFHPISLRTGKIKVTINNFSSPKVFLKSLSQPKGHIDSCSGFSRAPFQFFKTFDWIPSFPGAFPQVRQSMAVLSLFLADRIGLIDFLMQPEYCCRSPFSNAGTSRAVCWIRFKAAPTFSKPLMNCWVFWVVDTSSITAWAPLFFLEKFNFFGLRRIMLTTRA
ncbi:hypothetical protein HELRODRAFT_182639 [Helobdella robusta]|uniref:Uncharacterized protein n=1 Tax=Helobdella robusta TaxID=6412 RepID=T1FII9_HELRO|nr:hypothetical protein HELRODRAFT_182639 [Helobdella robusta]ESN90806.1 hypothetical protein HELRODRAFT_182639 [Helobdella robusta]